MRTLPVICLLTFQCLWVSVEAQETEPMTLQILSIQEYSLDEKTGNMTADGDPSSQRCECVITDNTIRFGQCQGIEHWMLFIQGDHHDPDSGIMTWYCMSRAVHWEIALDLASSNLTLASHSRRYEISLLSDESE